MLYFVVWQDKSVSERHHGCSTERAKKKKLTKLPTIREKGMFNDK